MYQVEFGKLCEYLIDKATNNGPYSTAECAWDHNVLALRPYGLGR
jgi:hypothetical protein